MTTLSGPRGLSRFAADLPAVSELITLGEGDTPLVPLPRLAERLGLRALSAKLETLNPTGSYKDRVAAPSVSLACDRGQAGWIAKSSGNAGLAMAAYGARAGLPGFLCMDSTAPLEKRLLEGPQPPPATPTRSSPCSPPRSRATLTSGQPHCRADRDDVRAAERPGRNEA